jgi:cytoskeletal protein RodZ
MGRSKGGISELSVIRASRGVSLKDMAHSTKISLYYLQAIENGQINKLPGGIYTRSYVRQYADAIDLSHEDLLQRLGISYE